MITGYIEMEEDVQRRLAEYTKPLAPKEYGCYEDVQFTIPRGTPYTLKFNIKDFKIWQYATSGHWWYSNLKNGDKAFFGIKKHPDDANYVYARIVTVNWTYQHNKYGVLVDTELGDMTSHGDFSITLSESDTDIEPGIYYYSIAALVSDKKNGDLSKYEYKDPCFVEISPPVPFRIRPMAVKLTDMYDEYVRLLANVEERISVLMAKEQTTNSEEERQAIKTDISSLNKIRFDYQTEMKKIQKRLTS